MSFAEEAPVPASWISRLLAHPVFRIAVPLLIAGIAVFVLHYLATHIKWSDVKADVAATSDASLLWAVVATVVSFVGMALYDVIAVESVAKGKVPLRIAAMAGACGYAVSNFLGFSYLTGTAVRYRAYASLVPDITLIAGVIATSWIAFWMGIILVLGGLLTFHPAGLSTVIDISGGTETAIGVALLVALAGLFAWLATGERKLSLHGEGFALPNLRLSGLLTGASIVDIVGAALALYVLMPDDLSQSFPYFFVIYIAATGLGILSHAPAGIGVFEAVMIAGLGGSGRSDLLAALLLYRAIYTFMPFLLATLGLAAVWALTSKHHIGAAASWTYRLTRPIVPMFAAGIALIAGTTLLVSGSLPTNVRAMRMLGDVLPVSFIEASHLAGSITGLLLIIISRGLYRKLYRAWIVTLGLMAFGLVATLFKQPGWIESISLITSFGILLLFKSAFYRVDGASIFRLNGTWIVSVITLFAVVVWIGVFAYSHVAYQDDLWWDFALKGNASRFMRASLVGAIVLAVVCFNSIMNNRSERITAQPIPDLVRKLVAASEDADAQITLTGDKAFLIADDESAYLAYADTGSTLVTYGEPVGDPETGAKLIWKFREQADQAGRRCAFYSVSPAYVPTYLDLGLSIIKIGEVARVDLTSFSLEGSSKKNFRQAKNRAIREGYKFDVIPAAEIKEFLPKLHEISDAWLVSKQGSEKAFSLGAFSDEYNSYFDHAVLRKVDTDEIVAFANLFQSGNRNELSLDLMRYTPGGPNFVMDALFAELMTWGAEQGFHWFSLGAAPFSGIENHQLASLWNRIGGFAYEHGEHFYHFEGLRAFKQKFGPVWTPNYLACPGGLAVPHVLYEVNGLISGGIKGLIK
ncbi:MAG: phosphatidylglycerol lysyltransferase [Paracoccaceae bacterium]|jgi:phosphatidylglycerol lysyltransferase